MKILIAGHEGMVGSAICRLLVKRNIGNIIGVSSKNLDLRNQFEVLNFFRTEKFDIVIDAAAVVGGIEANASFPYRFLMENMQIQNNLIDSALKTDVQKFIFLGSSCIYPKYAEQPLKEEYLLSGSLETTNQWYAVAKISGVKLCEAVKTQFGKEFVSLLPTNLYGPNDNFDLETSHVLPAIMRKIHEAKVNNTAVHLWGSGTPLREFLFVDDLAEAVVNTVVNSYPDCVYNVGSGREVRIMDLAELISEVIGFKGEIVWDTDKPDGTPRKLLDSTRINDLGWKHSTSLREGIEITYSWYLSNLSNLREVKHNKSF